GAAPGAVVTLTSTGSPKIAATTREWRRTPSHALRMAWRTALNVPVGGGAGGLYGGVPGGALPTGVGNAWAGSHAGGSSAGASPLRGNQAPLWSTSAAAVGPQVTHFGCSGASR